MTAHSPVEQRLRRFLRLLRRRHNHHHRNRQRHQVPSLKQSLRLNSHFRLTLRVRGREPQLGRLQSHRQQQVHRDLHHHQVLPAL